MEFENTSHELTITVTMNLLSILTFQVFVSYK